MPFGEGNNPGAGRDVPRGDRKEEVRLNINVGEEIENLRRASAERKQRLDSLRRDATTAEKRRQLSSLKRELGEEDGDEDSDEDRQESSEEDEDSGKAER